MKRQTKVWINFMTMFEWWTLVIDLRDPSFCLVLLWIIFEKYLNDRD